MPGVEVGFERVDVDVFCGHRIEQGGDHIIVQRIEARANAAAHQLFAAIGVHAFGNCSPGHALDRFLRADQRQVTILHRLAERAPGTAHAALPRRVGAGEREHFIELGAAFLRGDLCVGADRDLLGSIAHTPARHLAHDPFTRPRTPSAQGVADCFEHVAQHLERLRNHAAHLEVAALELGEQVGHGLFRLGFRVELAIAPFD